MANSKAFYLKINRKIDPDFLYLKKWLDIVEKFGYDCYILCDDKALIFQIMQKFSFLPMSSYIMSDRVTLKDFVRNTFAIRWWNTAHALLTPFIHSKVNNYKCFWNIDADDNAFLLPADECVKMLKMIEQYADEHDSSAYSFDVWRSRSNNKHWSFGSTYTINNIDWLNVLESSSKKEDWLSLDKDFHLDCYFTYLKDNNLAKLETYSFDNLYFIHYGDSILFSQKNSVSLFPNSKRITQNHPWKIYKIADDCLNFDLGISENQAYEYAMVDPILDCGIGNITYA